MDIENLQPDQLFRAKYPPHPPLPLFFSILDSVKTNSQFEKPILRVFFDRTRFPVRDNDCR